MIGIAAARPGSDEVSFATKTDMARHMLARAFAAGVGDDGRGVWAAEFSAGLARELRTSPSGGDALQRRRDHHEPGPGLRQRADCVSAEPDLVSDIGWPGRSRTA